MMTDDDIIAHHREVADGFAEIDERMARKPNECADMLDQFAQADAELTGVRFHEDGSASVSYRVGEIDLRMLPPVMYARIELSPLAAPSTARQRVGGWLRGVADWIEG